MVVVLLLNISLALCLLILQYLDYTFTCFTFASSVFPFFDVIYLWESISGLLAVTTNNISSSLDLGYLGIIFIPLTIGLYGTLLSRRVHILISTPMTQLKTSKQGRIYLHILYSRFLNRHRSSDLFYLSTMIRQHIRDCNSSVCMCFFLQTHFAPKDYSVSRLAKTPAYHIKWIKGSDEDTSKANDVAIFRDEYTITNLRTNHSQATNTTNKVLSASAAISPTHYREGQLLSLESSANMCRAMCSFLVTLSDRLSEDIFFFFADKIAFLLYEYQNYVATIVSLYSFIHSVKYMKERSFFKDFILQYYLSTSKMMLNDLMNNNKENFLRLVDFSRVFDYRERTHVLRLKLKELLIIKIDLYSASGSD